jgi:WD40 repeat protein
LYESIYITGFWSLGEVLRILQGHTDWVTAISYLSSNINNISYQQLLASCSYDHSIRLWNARTGDCLKVLQYDEAYLLDGLSFAPNSCILATGASNGSIYLWDVEQEECIKSLNAHTRSVRSVSWSPDGQILAGGSQDSKISLSYILHLLDSV